MHIHKGKAHHGGTAPELQGLGVFSAFSRAAVEAATSLDTHFENLMEGRAFDDRPQRGVADTLTGSSVVHQGRC